MTQTSMEEPLPEQEQPASTSKKSILTNPILMGWLSIVGTLLGIYGIYQAYVSNKEVKPVYRILSDAVLTESRTDSRIKVFFDSVEVENVRVATIALWNAGNEFLPKEAISKDKPITVGCNKAISILEFKTVKTTRPELKLIPTLYVDNDLGTPADTLTEESEHATLEIEGDEGLEAQDGAVFQIIYTTKANECLWFAYGRIKGLPDGIILAVGREYFSGSIVFYLFPFFIGFMIYTYITIVDPVNVRTKKWVMRFVYLGVIIGLVYAYFRLSPFYTNAVDLPTTLQP